MARDPYEELRRLVASKGGIMTHCKRVKNVHGGAWVIYLNNKMGVFTRRHGDSGFPELENLYLANTLTLTSNAFVSLYSMLEDIVLIQPDIDEPSG